VDQDRLTLAQTTVHEQRMPRGETGLRHRGGVHVVEGRGLGCAVARVDRDQLGGATAAVPVDEAVHLVADREAGGAESERDDLTGELVRGDDRGAVTPGAIGVDRPEELARREAGGVHLHEDVSDRQHRVGRGLVHQAVDGHDPVARRNVTRRCLGGCAAPRKVLPSTDRGVRRCTSALQRDASGVESAFGRNLRRLVEIKARYDPENLFRLNNNIAPAP
jgi:Berberine and berberine like